VGAETVVVVAGAEAVVDARRLPRSAVVVAADGGLAAARSAGMRVDVVVGDFDSVSGSAVTAAAASGARVVRHPAEKDATDLELALDEAVSLEASRVLVIGPGAGRLDHLLSMLLLLGSEKYAGREVDAVLGPARVHVVRGRRELDGAVGEAVSLLALHGPAEGVVTEGLVYPLRGETLAPGSSRGVSNELAGAAAVTVGRGVLLAVFPGHVR
jgi:thiamine pyrophosphokinase